ncbi:MAG: hypothetical protein FJ167_06440 [Gammaproteobacteria bacterium]|nr:hypothetical protein [Gammaproteobacteria bacterium]
MSLTIAVTAGKTIARNELVNNAKLNALGLPTLAVSGSTSTAQIGDDTVTAAKAHFGPWFYCTASGGNNITLDAAGHSITLVEGMIARFKVDITNTGAVDITFGGSTANLYRYYNSTTAAGVELAAGDLRSGQQVEIIYDGTQWQMLSPIGNNAVVVGTDAGSTDDYVIAPSPSVRALADLTGTPVVFKANTINDTSGGGATLAVSGLTATGIRKSKDVALVAGDIKAGQWVTVTYDGTYFQLISPVTVTDPSVRTTVSVRQTVLTGPVDTNGHPDIISYSGQNISLLATSTSPLVVAFAAGHDANGAVDYIARYTANTSSAWTLPTINATYYLFIDRDASTAAITYGYTITRPTYVDDDAASITSGAHTFLINAMQMYLGDGATASVKQRVFVGESVVSGGAITSVTSYMFAGRFKSSADQSFNLDNSSKSETHKLGLKPDIFHWTLVNQTGSDGYAQNDEVLLPQSHNANGVFSEASSNATTCTLRYMFGTYPPYVLNATPALDLIAAAAWKLRCYASRGW